MRDNFSAAYMASALAFSAAELEVRSSLADWLPDSIIDCHVHCNLDAHVLDVDDTTFHHMMSTFPSFSLEQSYTLRSLLYPSKRVRSLRFSHVFRGIDHRAANIYLCEHKDPADRVALYGIPTDIEYTVQALRSMPVSALKMYPAYFSPRAQTIYQYFPSPILEEVQGLGLPIILHLPKPITECREDLWGLIRDFPKLNIVLAHLGLPNFATQDLENVYREFAQCEYVYMDTAMRTSVDVLRLAFNAFGPDRILFGSDEPLNLIRAATYRHPELGQRIVSEYNYHWLDSAEQARYGYIAKGAMHVHWQSLVAIQSALSEYDPATSLRARELVFERNAARLFGF